MRILNHEGKEACRLDGPPGTGNLDPFSGEAITNKSVVRQIEGLLSGAPDDGLARFDDLFATIDERPRQARVVRSRDHEDPAVPIGAPLALARAEISLPFPDLKATPEIPESFRS